MMQRHEVVRVRRESVEDTISRLETYVRRFERRYECTSEAMLSAVVNKFQRETAEIGQWMMSYQALADLRTASSSETGTTTTTTR